MAAVLQAADLYGMPLEEFVTERDALAQRLRDRGDRDQAASVSRLRKPTTDVWALNQVARSHREKVERLLETHRALRTASDGDAVRRASDERRRVVDDLTEAATFILERGGRSSGGEVRDRIVRTLLAAAGDSETERALSEGTLERSAEISPQWPTIEVSSGSIGSRQTHSERRREVQRLESHAEELTAHAAGLRQRARQARAALEEARREAADADRAAREAEQAARKAKDQVESVRRKQRRSSQAS